MSVRSDKSIRSFYDHLSPEYDRMTCLPERFGKELDFFRFLVKKYSIRTAVDAGCGTGFHALLLSQLGVKVTAVDISRKMILAARNNSRKYHLPIGTRQVSFMELSETINNRVDAIVCMGNALAHLLTGREILESLINFYTVLRPGGILVLQLVNFDRILKEKNTLQNERQTAGIVFRRLYRYHKKSITFIIEILGESKKESLKKISIRLHPLRNDELRDFLNRSGFTVVEQFGSIAREPYSSVSSRDCIVVAQK